VRSQESGDEEDQEREHDGLEGYEHSHGAQATGWRLKGPPRPADGSGGRGWGVETWINCR
jgi:hypothetical protein